MSIPFSHPSCPYVPQAHLGHWKVIYGSHSSSPKQKHHSRLAPSHGHRHCCSADTTTEQSPLHTVLPESGILAFSTCWIPQIQGKSTEEQGFHNSKQKAPKHSPCGLEGKWSFHHFFLVYGSKKEIDKISINSPSASCSIKGEWLLLSPSFALLIFPCGAETVPDENIPLSSLGFHCYTIHISSVYFDAADSLSLYELYIYCLPTHIWRFR